MTGGQLCVINKRGRDVLSPWEQRAKVLSRENAEVALVELSEYTWLITTYTYIHTYDTLLTPSTSTTPPSRIPSLLFPPPSISSLSSKPGWPATIFRPIQDSLLLFLSVNPHSPCISLLSLFFFPIKLVAVLSAISIFYLKKKRDPAFFFLCVSVCSFVHGAQHDAAYSDRSRPS